jgi:transcriptional regulator with XRE-family HTH domain
VFAFDAVVMGACVPAFDLSSDAIGRDVSNAYLSQVERGLHDPTLRVLVQIGDALEISVEDILSRGGERSPASGDGQEPSGVEAAIQADPRLADAEKDALRAVYRSYLEARERAQRAARNSSRPARAPQPGGSGASSPSA